MGLLWKAAVLVLILGIAAKYYLSSRQSPIPPPTFGGHVEPGFEAVKQAFRKNFDDGYESDGAAFAVCHRGKLVVDLWGGYADKMAVRPWKEDTMTMAFSTTKAVAALVVATLVDKGHISYDDLVTKHWPEFGAKGKADITVKMLVSHQGGLAALDEAITPEVIRDWRKMSKAFENQAPNWSLGTRIGYHALTFGWLCDQLVRRVDPQHRSLGKYFHEEIAKRFGIDFFIGLPRDQLYRVARMTLPSTWDSIKLLDDWAVAKMMYKMFFVTPNSLWERVMKNPDWLDSSGGKFPFNNPDIQELEVPGANGIGTARGLAQLFCLLGGSELLSKNTLKKISNPVVIDQVDLLIGDIFNVTSGWGFFHSKSPENHYQLGHPGYGGQNAKFDPHEYLAFAYLRSNMSPEMGDSSRTFRKLQSAVYESIKALKNKT